MKFKSTAESAIKNFKIKITLFTENLAVSVSFDFVSSEIYASEIFKPVSSTLLQKTKKCKFRYVKINPFPYAYVYVRDSERGRQTALSLILIVIRLCIRKSGQTGLNPFIGAHAFFLLFCYLSGRQLMTHPVQVEEKEPLDKRENRFFFCPISIAGNVFWMFKLDGWAALNGKENDFMISDAEYVKR